MGDNENFERLQELLRTDPIAYDNFMARNQAMLKVKNDLERQKMVEEKERIGIENERIGIENERMRLAKLRIRSATEEYVLSKLPKDLAVKVSNSVPVSLYDEFLVDSGKKLIKWAEDNFGREYPRDILNFKNELLGQQSSSPTESFFTLNIIGDVATFKFIEVTSRKLIEFFPFSFIFVRDCFKSMFNELFFMIQQSAIIILGDPGIGKTTFLRFVFVMLEKRLSEHLPISSSLSFKKLFWVMESGFWVFFDGANIFSGNYENLVWMEDDVLLLVDGRFKDKYLAKIKNVILFCSPDKANFHKLSKTTKSATLVMPTWTQDEVFCLFDFIPKNSENCLGFSLMKPFFKSLVSSFTSSSDSDEKSIESEEKRSKIKMNFSKYLYEAGISTYDEVNSALQVPKNSSGDYDKISVTEFLRENVMRRFQILGGRIRQLINPNISFMIIRDQIIKAISSLSELNIAEHSSFEVEPDIPSMVYSLSPPINGHHLFPYRVTFASDFIFQLAIDHFKTLQKNTLKNVFESLKSEKMLNSALLGQLFERAVHNFLFSAPKIELNCVDLGIQKNLSKLKFGSEMNFESYSHKDPDLHKFLPSSGSIGRILYLKPVSRMAPQVDSIALRMSGSIEGTVDFCDFYQITISSTHPINRSEVLKLCNSFGITMSQIRFIYLVPEQIFGSFSRQTYCIEKEDKNVGGKIVHQFVAAIPNEAFIIENL